MHSIAVGILFLVVFAAAGGTAPAVAQTNPVGTYAVLGINQDKTTYAGEVTVIPNGPGYQVLWVIDGEGSNGSALLVGNVLCIGNVSDKRATITQMVFDASGNAEGTWLMRETPQLGQERWIKR